MSQENYQKTIDIFNTLTKVVADMDVTLKSAMKFVPISRQDGIELHKQYDEIIKVLNNLTHRK